MNISLFLPTTARNFPTARPSLVITENPFFEAESLAHDLINDLLESCSLLLYENSLDRNSIPYSVSATLITVFSLTESNYIRHEPVYDHLWEEATEPESAPIDPWARNVIPVITKVRIVKKIANLPIGLGSKSQKSFNSKSSALGILKKTKQKASFEMNTIAEGVSFIPGLKEKVVIDEEEEFARMKKEKDLKKKKDEIERMKKMREEEKEFAKKLLKEEKKVKERELTHDCKGNIIRVAPLVFGNFFEEDQPVKYLPAKSPTGEKRQKKLRIPPRDLSVQEKSRTQALESEWVKNVIIKPSPITENMTLNPNVTLIYNHRSILPPQVKHLTLSRKEYLQPASQKSPNRAFSTDKKSLSFSSFKSEKKDIESKKDFFENFPDYEEMKEKPEIGKKMKEKPKIGKKSTKSVSPENVALGKTLHYASETKIEVLRPIDKFNLEIMNSQQWGVNPPLSKPVIVSRVPHKLNLKEMREIYGDILKKPKDAPFMTVQELWKEKSGVIKKPKDRPYVDRVIKKKKMPPPPFGQSMIHGYSKGNSGSNSFN